jgi:hypothetical protein
MLTLFVSCRLQVPLVRYVIQGNYVATEVGKGMKFMILSTVFHTVFPQKVLEIKAFQKNFWTPK